MKQSINLAQFIVKKLVIHDIPKHKKGDAGVSPNCSQAVSTLSDGLRLFFQDAVKDAMRRDQCIKICYNSATKEETHVPTLINEVLRNDELFVSHSITLAKRLFEVQKGNNAAGILMIIKGTISDKQVCCIMKLERDSGAQLIFDDTSNSYHANEVQNLMLTKKSKLFKVVLLVERDDFSVDFDGFSLDCQSNFAHKKGIGSFFFDFLDCVAYNDPCITTKNFYQYTRNFIEKIDDPILRAQLVQDLNSYLQKNQNYVSPQEFADDYLKTPESRDAYKVFLNDEKFPYTPFIRDDAFVKNQIEKFVINFENGISIVGNKGILPKDVKLRKDKNTGKDVVIIKSKIKKVQ